MQRVQIPFYLPSWLYAPMRKVRDGLLRDSAAPALDLSGDRDVEFSFVVGQLPAGPGTALDFGCGPGMLSLMAAMRGLDVTALDLMQQSFAWKDPRVRFVQGDLLKADLAAESFDVVINCSTVEHVGLAGRYGVDAEATGGDLRAMHRLRDLLKPGGMMILTIPSGQDAVFKPLHRVYGEERLPRLLDGFDVELERYWKKDAENRWAGCDRASALQVVATADYRNVGRCSYSLACFRLRKPATKSA